jgi:hypothetical protein
MRALFLFAAISSRIFAQDQAPPAGKFYGPLAAPWKVKLPVNPQTPLFKNLILPQFKTIQTPVTKCAVPLLEMNVPPASALPMATVAPPAHAAAPGGEAKSLLPPC